MLPKPLHDPDYWLDELGPLLKEVQFAFQLACPQALRFFAEYRKTKVNGPLLSNLIRYYALDYLTVRGYNPHEEPTDAAWYMRGLSNNGIELLYRNACIRIRKGLEAPIPMTASSQDFYQQVLPFWDELEQRQVVSNLLVLWNVDERISFSGLKLLRPVDGHAKGVRIDWQVNVPLISINVSEVVESEYMNSSELPLDPGKSVGEENEPLGEQTGTNDGE